MIALFGTQGGSSRALLLRSLQQTLGLSTLPHMDKTANGKPYFRDLPQLHFSLSHSAHFVLCALSDAPIGVDIEQLRPRREGLAQYALLPSEQAAFHALGGDWPAFYALWTKREAFIKQQGESLGSALRRELPHDLQFRSFVAAEYCAALCATQDATLPANLQIVWLPEQEEHICD